MKEQATKARTLLNTD